MVAPELSAKLPAPVQSTVPPFSSVRASRDTPLGLATLRVAPGSRMVRPLPLIVPPVHEAFPRTVKVPLPVTVGEAIELPSVKSLQSAGVFKVTETLFAINTLSFEPGTRPGVQLVAMFQSPLNAFVQVKTIGVKRA